MPAIANAGIAARAGESFPEHTIFILHRGMTDGFSAELHGAMGQIDLHKYGSPGRAWLC